MRPGLAPDSVPLSPELRTQLHRNLVEVHWLNNLESPRPRRQEWPAATGVACALPTELSNTLYINEPVADGAQLLREASAFFGRAAVWRVSAPTHLRESVEPAALAAGLQARPPVPRMVLDPIPESPPPPAGLSIRVVTDRSDLHDFWIAGGRGFRIPAWILRIAIPDVPAAPRPGTPGLRLLVGSAEGTPVATSAELTTDGVVGVFFVATVPEARRRGYGAALTWAAIRDGKAQGATVSYLQATEMGRPVYERMGYRRLDDYYDWRTPVSGLGQFRLLFRVIGLAARRRRKQPANPP